MNILAIDPGPVESAYVYYGVDRGVPREWAKLENGVLLPRLHGWLNVNSNALAIEMVASYGMAVGATVFETCVWAGRFIQQWVITGQEEPIRVYRKDVKLHLCHSMRAKDPNVRQALIDRYGGKEAAIGKKATPGVLYGLSGDCWAALAVAVTVAETRLADDRRAA